MLQASLANYGSQVVACQDVRKILLIDDDPAFRSLFSLVGNSLGYSVSAFESVASMTSFAFINSYDIAFVDYYLEGFTGVEIAEYVDVFFPYMSVFLVSGDRSILDLKALPESVRGVYEKSTGVRSIINQAVKLAVS